MPVTTPYADSHKMRKNIKGALSWMPKGYQTDDAVELLLATSARESRLGKFPDQPGMGGRGPFQVNPKTEEHLWNSYLRQNPKLAKGITKFTGVAGPDPAALTGNFPYSAIMARLAYTRAQEAIPSRKDPVGMANYWKKWYNTAAGQGTPEGFLETYHELIGGQK